MTRLLDVCVVALAAGSVCAAQAAVQQGARPSASNLADGVRQGDWAAIEKAGRSADPSLIPVLRELIARSGTDQRALITKDAAHFALAKLGDLQELQSRWCDAVSDRPAANGQRLFDLDVGGWFAVRALSQFLKPEYAERYYAALGAYTGERARDIAVQPLEKEIIVMLQDLVPPPFRVEQYDGVGPHEADAWLHWIKTHEPEFRNMKPTGEGVEMSLEACGKPSARSQRSARGVSGKLGNFGLVSRGDGHWR